MPADTRDDGPGGAVGAAAIALAVPPEAAGSRLDHWLPRALPGLSRRRAQRLADEGRVRDGDGRPVAKGARLVAGALLVVEVAAAAREPFRVRPGDDARVSTAHVDAEVVVLDKPAGLPTLPLEPGEVGTLAGVVAARFPEVLAFDPAGAGLLQRLDRDTSGLLAAARTAGALARLRAARRAHALEKTYVALVVGRPAPGRLEGRIARDPADGRRVVVAPVEASEGAFVASELVEVEPLGEGASLVRLVTRTGARHQVRAQLAAAGHPLLGDAWYGGPAVPGLVRHALHAAALALPGAPAVTSPLPADLRTLVEALRRR